MRTEPDADTVALLTSRLQSVSRMDSEGMPNLVSWECNAWVTFFAQKAQNRSNNWANILSRSICHHWCSKVVVVALSSSQLDETFQNCIKFWWLICKAKWTTLFISDLLPRSNIGAQFDITLFCWNGRFLSFTVMCQLHSMAQGG